MDIIIEIIELRIGLKNHVKSSRLKLSVSADYQSHSLMNSSITTLMDSDETQAILKKNSF